MKIHFWHKWRYTSIRIRYCLNCLKSQELVKIPTGARVVSKWVDRVNPSGGGEGYSTF